MTTSTPRSSSPTAMQRAKTPRTILAGPYGHPFHPVLVTVPIGAWVASLVFDLAATFGGEPEVFAKGAYWLVGIGILGALTAAVFGLMDLSTIPRGTKAFSTGLLHMALNLTVVALYVVNFAVRSAQGYDQVSSIALTLSVVALAILGVSGWLGGKLAYHYGVRVADESKAGRRLPMSPRVDESVPELVADGLHFPTSLAFDGDTAYVVESGLTFGGAPPGGRVWRLTGSGREMVA